MQTITLFVRAHVGSRREATYIQSYASRYAGAARDAWVSECEAGRINPKTREAHLAWEALRERVASLRRRLGGVIGQKLRPVDTEEAAYALKLALEVVEMHQLPGNRAWRYLGRKLQRFAKDYSNLGEL